MVEVFVLGVSIAAFGVRSTFPSVEVAAETIRAWHGPAFEVNPIDETSWELVDPKGLVVSAFKARAVTVH